MRLLIAVRSWTEHFDTHDQIQQTWGREIKALGADIRFFIAAQNSSPNPRQTEWGRRRDEVCIEAPEGRAGLARLTRGIFKWAMGKHVEYLFLTYPTITVNPAAVMENFNNIYDKFDYAGKFESSALEYPWASGQEGYFLSRQTFSELVATYPGALQEDQWVGQTLGPSIVAGDFKYLDTK